MIFSESEVYFLDHLRSLHCDCHDDEACLFNSLIVCVLFSVQHSLAVLMEKMFVAGPHFVRCIKPNRSKQPDQLDSKLVMDQVGSAESLQHLQRSSAAFSTV